MKFNEILVSLLKELEGNPSLSAEEIIKNKAEELAISEEEYAEIQLTNKYIDQFDKVVKEMDDARKEGVTRAEFVEERIQKALENVPAEKKDLFVQALSAPKDQQIEELTKELDETK